MSATRTKPKLPQPGASIRRAAGHYEILGETYAKFEFYEKHWNPYSRFLDVDKVDLILRKRIGDQTIYREVQVKFGKLYTCEPKWERTLFDVTSWRFFEPDEFAKHKDRRDFFVAYVLSKDFLYEGDIFIFPVRDFFELVRAAIHSKDKRKVYISRLKNDRERWVLRTKAGSFSRIDDTNTIDVSRYRRDFSSLDHTEKG